MSMKNVEKFFDLAKSNEELSKRLIKINSNIQEKYRQVLDYDQFVKKEIIPLAQEFGVTFSVDDFVEYTKSKLPKELSDEESANVSGGVSLKTAAITFGTLLSVSLGAAAFLGMGGGLEASALDPTETLNSSQKSRTTSKASHPKAVYNISDDEVNKIGPKIVTGEYEEGEYEKDKFFMFFDGKKVDDPMQINYLKAVKSKFDQQFDQQIKKKMQEQRLVQELAERTNNIENMSRNERIKLKRDIRKAIKSVENKELNEKLCDMLNFANKVSQEILRAERAKAQKLVQKINQIRHQAENISRKDKYQLKELIDDIDNAIEELIDIRTVTDVDQSTKEELQEELSEIEGRAEQARQEIIKAEEEKIAQIREIIENLADEDLENMSEEELSDLNRLIMEVPASVRPDDIDEFYEKLGEVIEKKQQEEMEQEDQAQKEQLLELAKYIDKNNITRLSDVPEEDRETFTENLNDVMETFYYNTNDISSLGETGQRIINLIKGKNSNEKARKKINRKPFKYEKIPYLPRVASNAEQFANKVIMEISRGHITSMSQVPQSFFEALRSDVITAVALLREAGMPVPDVLGGLYEEIINNDEYKIDYQKFPEGDFNDRGEIVKEGTEKYEILRVEHIKTQLKENGIWSLYEVKNLKELIADIAKYSTYFTANHLALRPSPQLSKLEREIRENSEFLKLVREAVEAPSQSEESKNEKQGHVMFAENVVKRPQINAKEYSKVVAPEIAKKNMKKKLSEIKNKRQQKQMIQQLTQKNQIRGIRAEQRKLYKGLAVHLTSNYPIENFEQDPNLGKKTEKLLKEFAQNTVINGGGTFFCFNVDGTYAEAHINDKVAEKLFKYIAIKKGPIYFDTTNSKNYNSLVNKAMKCVVLNNGRAKNIINAAKKAGKDGRQNLKELLKALIEIKNKGTYDHLPQFMKDMASNLLAEIEDLEISLD